MPSLQMGNESTVTPSALMAIKLKNPKKPDSPKRMSPLPRIVDEAGEDATDWNPPVPAIRLRYAPRPRSYVEILEDFKEHATSNASPISTRFSLQSAHSSQLVPDERDELAYSQEGSSGSPHTPPESLPPSPRKEDTVRRRKRFSLPALALHTSPVTTRPTIIGDGKGRRVSLVLGRSSVANMDSQSSFGQYDVHGLKGGVAAGKLSEILSRDGQS